MSEQIKPKPCPFCGSTRIVVGERYFMMCVDCGGTGPERTGKTSQAKFAADWSTRPGEDAAREQALDEAAEIAFNRQAPPNNGTAKAMCSDIGYLIRGLKAKGK